MATWRQRATTLAPLAVLAVITCAVVVLMASSQPSVVEAEVQRSRLRSHDSPCAEWTPPEPNHRGTIGSGGELEPDESATPCDAEDLGTAELPPLPSDTVVHDSRTPDGKSLVRPSTRGIGARISPWVGKPGEPFEDGRQTQLTFVHISDTHVGHALDAAYFEMAVKNINAMDPPPAFVIITGDVTDAFMPSQVVRFKEILARLEVTTYLVPGNHDVGFDPKPRNVHYWKTHFPKFATPYRRDQGDIVFIGIDSQLWNSRRKTPETEPIAKAQWDKLEAMLAEARDEDKRIMIMAHIPAVPSFYVTKVAQSWPTEKVDRYRALLEEYGVEAELSGHFHRDELYYSGKTALLNAPPISAKYSRRPSFRVMRVTNEGMSYRQVYFTRPEDTDLSYVMDMHGLTETTWNAWLKTFGTDDLKALWRIRHAGDRGADRYFVDLDHELYRSYVEHPFAYQPPTRRPTPANLLGDGPRIAATP